MLNVVGFLCRHPFKWSIVVQDGYKKPEGDMYMQTTHNSVYRELPLSKNVPVRPSSAGKANNITTLEGSIVWFVGTGRL
jgi:hypothetical protein